MPSGKIPDGIFLQAGLAVFVFRCLRTLKQKHCYAFQVPYAHKAVYLLGQREIIFKEKHFNSRRELAQYTGGTRAKRGGIQASEQQRIKVF